MCYYPSFQVLKYLEIQSIYCNHGWYMNLDLMVEFVHYFDGSYMQESCSNMIFLKVVTSVFDLGSGQLMS